MYFSFIEHLEGCTPLKRCRNCKITDFLEKELGTEKFLALVKLSIALQKKPPEPMIQAALAAPPEVEALSDSLEHKVNPDTRLDFCPGFREVPVRARKSLICYGKISTIGELAEKTQSEILEIEDFGERSLAPTVKWLDSLGYKLKDT